MAIHKLYPGIAVTVEVGGEAVDELDDPDVIQGEHIDPIVAQYEELHTVSKYIISETGEKFRIKFSVGPPLGSPKMKYTKIAFETWVDGLYVWTIHCKRPWFKEREGKTWEETISGPKEGKGRGCKGWEMSFAKIDADSETNLASVAVKRHMERLKKKGSIVVKVFNSNYGKAGGPTASETKGFLDEDGTTAPEKAMKGDNKTHGAALGEEFKTKRGEVYRYEKVDGEDYPLVIFRFTYRSEEALKQLHVIERTPSPSPPPSPEHSPSPDPEIVAANKRRIAELEALLAEEMKTQETLVKTKIKKENAGEEVLDNERPAKKQKKSGPPEIIVLDDSGDEAAGDDEGLFIS